MTDAKFFVSLQRHDITKKRIDAHGNVIEARQEGIGAPKVSSKTVLDIHQFLHICVMRSFSILFYYYYYFLGVARGGDGK